MFKHLVSELKEAVVCLRAGRVTLGYPFEPHPPEEGFRGKVVVDPERCIGCGACAMACVSRLITLSDVDGHRAVDFALRRCVHCGRCRDACPTQAIILSPQFETASPSMDDLDIHLRLKLVRCRECGAPVGTRRELERVAAELREKGGLAPETLGWLELCLDCKRKAALSTPSLALEVAR